MSPAGLCAWRSSSCDPLSLGAPCRPAHFFPSPRQRGISRATRHPPHSSPARDSHSLRISRQIGKGGHEVGDFLGSAVVGIRGGLWQDGWPGYVTFQWPDMSEQEDTTAPPGRRHSSFWSLVQVPGAWKQRSVSRGKRRHPHPPLGRWGPGPSVSAQHSMGCCGTCPLTSLCFLLPPRSQTLGQFPKRPQVWATGPGPWAVWPHILGAAGKQNHLKARRATRAASPPAKNAVPGGTHARPTLLTPDTPSRRKGPESGGPERGWGRALTALPFRVVAELAERHLHGEDEAAEHDLDTEGGDGHVHLDANLGDDDAVFLEAGSDHLTVEDDLDGDPAREREPGGGQPVPGAPSPPGTNGGCPAGVPTSLVITPRTGLRVSTTRSCWYSTMMDCGQDSLSSASQK